MKETFQRITKSEARGTAEYNEKEMKKKLKYNKKINVKKNKKFKDK